MLMALLLGMAFNFLRENDKTIPGIVFCSKTVLRIGVVLLGVRITFGEIGSLGIETVVIVVSGVFTTLSVGYLISRLLGLSPQFSILSAGAVAICGASAALAIASVLPENDKLEQRTILVVVGVTTLSTLAMLFYPLVISMLNFGDVDAGIFLGATIHDVAQVVGAGYTISQDAGDVATIVKLLRVLALVPVVLLVSLVFNRGVAGSKGSAKTVPWFLGGFCFVVVLNSMGAISDEVRVLLSQLSYWCLVCAVAALGIRTALEELSKVGPKPVMVLATQSIVLAALVGFLL
jgi:uncharacterized integral membrane protein (TIGR00698 family)